MTPTQQITDLLEQAESHHKASKETYRKFMVEIGAYARDRREAKGLTQEVLANGMHISEPYLSNLEAGKRDWSKETLRKWDGALRRLKTKENK